MQNKYTVSYILMVYNQEDFVEEAVKSTLAQNFNDMEIIISDDFSTDDSFQRIQSICKSYRGEKYVIVRQNSMNLGVLEHMNELVRIAQGELIVVGAGDDIAKPNKVSRIVDEWRKTKALMIGCNPEIIDEQGKVMGRFSEGSGWERDWSGIVRKGNASIFITAFDRQIFDVFGELHGFLPMEDQSLIFRASLMKPGSVRVIDEPLVQYRFRQHSLVEQLRFTKDCDHKHILIQKLRTKRLVFDSWLQDLSDIQFAHIKKKDRKTGSDILIRRIVCYQRLEQALTESKNGRSKIMRPEKDVSGSCIMVSYIAFLFPNLFSRFVSFCVRLKRFGQVRG